MAEEASSGESVYTEEEITVEEDEDDEEEGKDIYVKAIEN